MSSTSRFILLNSSSTANDDAAVASSATTIADSPTCWRRSRDRRHTSNTSNRHNHPPPPPSTTACAKLKARDRRRLREKRRSSGSNFVHSTDGTTSGDDDDQQHPELDRCRSIIPTTSAMTNLAVGASGKFRNSKSQSDLDADCEDNTADYDSTSILSETTTPNDAKLSTPHHHHHDEFRAHVQEIRVAGMEQLGRMMMIGNDESSPPHRITDRQRVSQLLTTIDHLNRQLNDANQLVERLRMENEMLKLRH